MRLAENGGRAVATDLMAMFGSVDTALFDAARLAATIMEANAASSIPPARLQGALDSAAAGFTKLVEGRKEMIQMHRKLASIKGETEHRETNWGCWGFLEEPGSGAAAAPAEANGISKARANLP